MDELGGMDESGLVRSAGGHALLPKEHAAPPFIQLPLVERADNEVGPLSRSRDSKKRLSRRP